LQNTWHKARQRAKQRALPVPEINITLVARHASSKKGLTKRDMLVCEFVTNKLLDRKQSYDIRVEHSDGVAYVKLRIPPQERKAQKKIAA